MDALTVRPARGADEWSALYAAVERPHMMQSWAYGEAKRAAGGRSRASHGLTVSRLIFERAGEPVAICQVLEKRVAGFRDRRLPGWCSAVLDLRLDEAALRAGLAPTWRNRLTGADRADLDFDVSEDPVVLGWLLAHHTGNMREK